MSSTYNIPVHNIRAFPKQIGSHFLHKYGCENPELMQNGFIALYTKHFDPAWFKYDHLIAPLMEELENKGYIVLVNKSIMYEATEQPTIFITGPDMDKLYKELIICTKRAYANALEKCGLFMGMFD